MDSISNIDQLINYFRKLSEEAEAVERLLATVIEILKEDILASLCKKLLNPSSINYHHTIKDVRDYGNFI